MRWQTIRLIFRREIRDQLRDRRTIFMIVVLPVLLYPALGLGMVQLTLNFTQEFRKIGIPHVETLPKTPPLLDETGTRFNIDLFRNPKNQRLYHIQPGSHWTEADVVAGKLDLLISFPEDAGKRLEAGESIPIKLAHNSTADESQMAEQSVRRLLESWEIRLVSERMTSIGRSYDFAYPLRFKETGADVAPAELRSGTIWSKFVPFILVMMALTGAFYPAVDLCAGEKERGTMETLLISPVSRAEIVMGKFLTILAFSLATTIFNLVSIGFTFGQLAAVVPKDAGPIAAELAPPSLLASLWMVVLLPPLAAFFSAICMALAVFAKSTKEGQYYLMPIIVITMPLIFLTLAPGVELTAFYSLVPVTNVALLLRALMLNHYAPAMLYFVPVLASTLVFSALALRFAIEQFNREEVLFREAERFEVGHWLRRLFRDKEPLPSGQMAFSCWIMILLLTWYSQGHLPKSGLAAMAIHLVAFVACPALFMSVLLTSSPRGTLALYAPAPLPTAIGLATVFTLHPLMFTFLKLLQRLFPVPEQMREVFEMIFRDESTVMVLIVVALLPAICEELAFRGFIMAGMFRRHTVGWAILFSSVLFGVTHMITPQMINATLLGLVLGLIATRTGSIFPGMVFHALHNGMVLLAPLYAPRYFPRWVKLDESGNFDAYTIEWVVGGALASSLLIGWLATLPSRLPRSVEARSASEGS